MPAGFRYNIAPNIDVKIMKSLNFFDFISVPICLSICPIMEIRNLEGLFVTEIKVASSLIAIAALIYMFLKLNSKSQKIINEVDGIIDKFIHGDLSSSEALEQLKYARYGGSSKQIVHSELSQCLSDIKQISEIDTVITQVIDSIKAGNINPEKYHIYRRFNTSVLKDIRSINDRCGLFVDKIQEMILLPNSKQFTDDLSDLNQMVGAGISQNKEVFKKYDCLKTLLNGYCDKCFCRHSGSLCETAGCKNRAKKMSIRYAFERYKLMDAVKILYYNWFKTK